MAMLNDVKRALGIALPVTVYDIDLENLIDAAKLDMKICGIKAEKLEKPDALINRAVIFYCFAYFKKTDGNDCYLKAYETLRTHLSLAGEYKDV